MFSKKWSKQIKITFRKSHKYKTNKMNNQSKSDTKTKRLTQICIQ